MKFPSKLKGCSGAVLDTMVLVYLFENHGGYGAVCEKLLQHAEDGDFTGVITPVTLAELLVRPLQAGRGDLADRYQSAIRHAANIRLCDFSWQTGRMAGALRAKYGLPLPDMFQVACALEHGRVLVTNDMAMRKIEDVDVVFLDDMR